MHFDKAEMRSEAFVRRTLSIFLGAILKAKLISPNESHHNQGLTLKVIPQLIAKLVDLVDLRYDNEINKVLIFSAKGTPTLFYTCGLYLILIASFLINPE